MQAKFRGALVRRQTKKVFAATIRLQSFVRKIYAKQRVIDHIVTTGITAFQAIVRGHIARRSHFQARAIHFHMRRLRAIRIQAFVRGTLQRQKSHQMHAGVILLQSRVRGLFVRKRYQRVRRRMFYRRMIAGIILLQARARGRQSRLLVCSKAAANVAWNDLMITTENIGQVTKSSTLVKSYSVDAIRAATLFQSLWRGFRAKIVVAQKLLLSWRMDCYYPSHIKNQLSLLRAGTSHVFF